MGVAREAGGPGPDPNEQGCHAPGLHHHGRESRRARGPVGVGRRRAGRRRAAGRRPGPPDVRGRRPPPCAWSSSRTPSSTGRPRSARRSSRCSAGRTRRWPARPRRPGRPRSRPDTARTWRSSGAAARIPPRPRPRPPRRRCHGPSRANPRRDRPAPASSRRRHTRSRPRLRGTDRRPRPRRSRSGPRRRASSRPPRRPRPSSGRRSPTRARRSRRPCPSPSGCPSPPPRRRPRPRPSWRGGPSCPGRMRPSIPPRSARPVCRRPGRKWSLRAGRKGPRCGSTPARRSRPPRPRPRRLRRRVPPPRLRPCLPPRPRPSGRTSPARGQRTRGRPGRPGDGRPVVPRQKFAEAGRLYGTMAARGLLPSNRRPHWAYCRLDAVVRQINNGPRSTREWDAIESEVRSIQRLAPDNWFGDYLMKKVAEARRTRKRRGKTSEDMVVRGSSPDDPPTPPPPSTPESATPRRRPGLLGRPRPTPAAPPAPAPTPGGVESPQGSPGTLNLPEGPSADATAIGSRTPELASAAGVAAPAEADAASWQVHESPNFQIYHRNPRSPRKSRRSPSRSGRPRPGDGGAQRLARPWSPRCEVYLYPNRASVRGRGDRPAGGLAGPLDRCRTTGCGCWVAG